MPVSLIPKFTVPKSASGVTPPELGASAIHSADESFALGNLVLVLKILSSAYICNADRKSLIYVVTYLGRNNVPRVNLDTRNDIRHCR